MIFDILIGIVQVILMPFDALIASTMPDLVTALDALSGYIQMISGSLGWALSVTGIPLPILTLIVSYFVFKLTTPVLFWVIKLVLKWVKQIR